MTIEGGSVADQQSLFDVDHVTIANATRSPFRRYDASMLGSVRIYIASLYRPFC